MSNKRKSLSKSLRFEVFKRDSFTCQYCGRMAPDVVLEIDHINPVANGVDNDIVNLITSCFDCNRGKGKRQLTDKEEVKKQQEQLKELNKKREQLEMMLQWRDDLSRFEDEQIYEFEERFCDFTQGTLTDTGRNKVKKWVKKFGLIEIINCMETSVSQYYVENDKNSIEKVFNYIPRIATNRARQEKDPWLSDKYYIRGILRNRGMLYNEGRVWGFLNYVLDPSAPETEKKIYKHEVENIKDFAKESRNWTEFWELVNENYDKGDGVDF